MLNENIGVNYRTWKAALSANCKLTIHTTITEITSFSQAERLLSHDIPTVILRNLKPCKMTG